MLNRYRLLAIPEKPVPSPIAYNGGMSPDDIMSPDIISDMISNGMESFGKNLEKRFGKKIWKKKFGKNLERNRSGRIETGKPLEANRNDTNKEKN